VWILEGPSVRACSRYDEPVTPGPVPTGLSAEQAAREATLRELGEAMVAIEAATTRVRRAIETLRGRPDSDPNIVAALTRSASELDATRRRLHQDGYLSQPQVPLFLPDVGDESGPLSLFPVEPAGE
jgi:hypothetical protein